MNTTPDVAALIAELRHWTVKSDPFKHFDIHVRAADALEALSQSPAPVSETREERLLRDIFEDPAPVSETREAAEFIERELRTGFLNPNVVAPGSKADTALRTLIAAAARTELGMADDEPNAATGHDTRAEYDKLTSPVAPVLAAGVTREQSDLLTQGGE